MKLPDRNPSGDIDPSGFLDNSCQVPGLVGLLISTLERLEAPACKHIHLGLDQDDEEGCYLDSHANAEYLAETLSEHLEEPDAVPLTPYLALIKAAREGYTLLGELSERLEGSPSWDDEDDKDDEDRAAFAGDEMGGNYEDNNTREFKRVYETLSGAINACTAPLSDADLGRVG